MGDECRVEHDSMGEVEVPKDALWRAQTQRAVENFPISGTRLEARPHPRAGAGQGGRGAGQRPARRARRRRRRRDRGRRRRGRGRRARRRVPGRRLPDRLGHQLQHEHERGARLAGLAAGRRGPPQRPRQRQPVQQRRLPDLDPRRRRPGRPRPAAAGAGATSRELAGGQGRGVRRAREGRPHAPDGRHAGDARPGVRRLRRDRAAGLERLAGDAAPGGGAAAGRHRRRHRHQHPARLRRGRDRGARRR